jgi:short subunit dehydrogenase-like uncharacterized protein
VLDLVLFGATGFAGRLVARRLAERAQGLAWALAGRDLARLAAIREDVGAPADLPLVWADAADAESLRDVARRGRCVVATVGPYSLVGANLVAACAREGCDYLDLCGEPAWMRRMIDAHDVEARASGARILFSCGFDSVPFDLGVLLVQQATASAWNAPAPRVSARVRDMKAALSGGTLASLRASQRDGADPYLLTPGFQGPIQPDADAARFDDELGLWVAPFVMSPINSRNIHRSNLLMGHRYGRGFRYDEMVCAGRGAEGERRAQAIAATAFKPDAWPDTPAPTAADLEGGFFDLLFTAARDDGRRLRLGVKGDADPGYGATAKILVECALALAVAQTPGGIWTPAAALGPTLADRLEAHAGLRFAFE